MRHRNGSGIWAGAILVIFGALLLADNFDLLYYLTPGHFPPFRLFSWPVIMFIIGAVVLSNDSRSIFGWFFIIIGGSNILSRFMDFSFRGFIGDFWPLLLIAFGILLLLRKRDRHSIHFDHEKFEHDFKNKFHNQFEKDFKKNMRSNFYDKSDYRSGEANSENQFDSTGANTTADNNNQPKSDNSTGDDIDIVAIFNAIKRRITSDNFLGGRISVLFGGVDLFLNDCKLGKGEQVLDISCLFGGVDLYVPRDWRIIVKTVTIFGGFDDHRFQDTSNIASDDRVLIVRGFVLFGGGDIKN